MTTCTPTPISTLYSTLSTRVPTEYTTSTPVIFTPQPTTTTWITTSCSSSTYGGGGRARNQRSAGTFLVTTKTASATATLTSDQNRRDVSQSGQSSRRLVDNAEVEGGIVEARKSRHSPGREGETEQSRRAFPSDGVGDGDDDDEDDDEDDTGNIPQRCSTMTSTSVIYAQPTTSWSTFYVPTFVHSDISVPIQTVYRSGECHTTASVLVGAIQSSTSSDAEQLEDYATFTAPSSVDHARISAASGRSTASAQYTPSTTAVTASSTASHPPITPTPTEPLSIITSTTPPTTLAGVAISSSDSFSQSSSDVRQATPITSPAPTSAADSSSHYNKAVSTGAAIGGVVGLFALLAGVLFMTRWWKRRTRVKRTNELRSSWFYGGDVREDPDSDDRSIANSRTIQRIASQPPQSRFSAPSMTSRQSLALPSFLTHLRRSSSSSTFSGGLPSLKNIGKSFFSSGWNAPDESSLRYQKRHNGGSPAWAEKYPDAQPIPIAASSASVGGNVPTAALMSPPEYGSATLGTNMSGLRDSRYPDTGFSWDQPAQITGSEQVAWGSSYATSLDLEPSLPHLAASRTSEGETAPNIIFTAPSDVSGSAYVVRTNWSVQNSNDPYLSTTSQGANLDRSASERSANDPNIIQSVANSFPLPPLSFPTPTYSSAIITPFSSSPTQNEHANTSHPSQGQDKPLPAPPNFSHPHPHDSHRITRSTAHSSGIWEYNAYADSTRESTATDSHAPQLTKARISEHEANASGRDTRNWYEKSLWDGESSRGDPMSMYDASLYGAMVDESERKSRKSVKSVRWEDEDRSVAMAL
ncbi:hypothetical protein CI109_100237 [Kwoniella shandongensis]|uniref:Uncharacterized protein n=1 Tax=Kwoniella shandongensis TaxID=1734106 RepID=A0A5M6BRK8_9TREE|nr:uncharacterized protein CI109_006227 [Kwoniella shandongensis]KAA5525423.1 hypothetical protein CI109_006227 [Kwoniella shandongensis]